MTWITCPNCGLDIELEPEKMYMVCQECGATVDVEAELEQRKRYLKEKRKE